MSKKNILNEATVRKFMKLAEIGPLTSEFIEKNYKEKLEESDEDEKLEESDEDEKLEESEDEDALDEDMDYARDEELNEEEDFELDALEPEPEPEADVDAVEIDLAGGKEAALAAADLLDQLADGVREAAGAEEAEPEPEFEPEPELEEPDLEEPELEEPPGPMMEALVKRIAARVAKRILDEKKK